jgi:N-methylhydantoinase A
VNAVDVKEIFDSLVARAKASREAHELTGSKLQLQRSVHMKYVAQVHDIEVLVPEDIAKADINAKLTEVFTETYNRRYGEGAGLPSGGVEITSFQLRSTSPVPKPSLPTVKLTKTKPRLGRRKVYWSEVKKLVDTPVLAISEKLPAGTFDGPMLVDLPDSVIVLRPGQQGRFDTRGNFVIEEKTRR